MTADIRAIRLLYADWYAGLHAVGPDDVEGRRALDLLAYQLAAEVPDLCDALERLISEREEGGRPRIRDFAKFDSRGGKA